MDIAIIEIETGHVVSIVGADTLFDPGPTHLAVDATGEVAYAGCTWSEGGGFVEPAPPVLDPAEDKERLIAYAAEKRWRVETSGIEVGGALIRTDEKSQNRVAGASLLAMSDPGLTVIDWEAMPGDWVSVAKADMIAIGVAVGRHVQACFTALKAVQAEIEAGTINTTEQIDAAEWPG